jgi:hypothetical protein
MRIRDICALLHNPDFRAVSDRNSKILFLREFPAKQCFVLIIDKTLAEVYDINIGKMKKISCNARRQQENPIPRFGYPPEFVRNQEVEIVSRTHSSPLCQCIPAGMQFLDQFHIDIVSESSDSTNVSTSCGKFPRFHRAMWNNGGLMSKVLEIQRISDVITMKEC